SPRPVSLHAQGCPVSLGQQLLAEGGRQTLQRPATDRLRGRQVPGGEGGVLGVDGEEYLAIGPEAEVKDRTRWSPHPEDFLSARQFPQPHGSLITRGQETGIGRERNGTNRFFVSPQREHVLAARDTPEPDGRVVAAGCQVASVR